MHYLDYNEKITHGTSDFPIAFYHVDEDHPRYNFPFHWHKEMEVIHILEGSLHIYLDEEEYLAKKGDILLIEDGVIHGATPEHCVYDCSVFNMSALLAHTDVCKRYFRLISRHQIQLQHFFPAPKPSISESDRIRQAVLCLLDALRYPHAGGELIALAALYQLFGTLFEEERYTQLSETPRHEHKKMDQLKPVLEYIDANYASAVTLTDLSRLAGMTPKYFCRFFRTAIHRTPMDYLNYCRVERACQMLGSADLSIAEIGECCGFNDSSYFVKTFKKYMGITPKQYALKQ